MFTDEIILNRRLVLAWDLHATLSLNLDPCLPSWMSFCCSRDIVVSCTSQLAA